MNISPMSPHQSKPDARTFTGLRELQRLMASAAMRPLGDARQMKGRWKDGRSMARHAAAFIKPNDRLTAFERLEIYNRQYWFRLLECFQEDFPGLQAVLGQDRLFELATAYLSAHPSTSYTLRNLGRQLVPYLEANLRFTRPQHRLVLDMARLEWAHIEAFDQDARPPLTPGELLDSGLASARLRLQPHLTLLHLHYPLDEFLIKVRHRNVTHTTASHSVADGHTRKARPCAKPLLSGRQVYLAVHRHRNAVYYKRLKLPQYRLLRAIHEGCNLTESLARMARDTSHLRPDDVQTWFSDWAKLGWLLPGSAGPC